MSMTNAARQAAWRARRKTADQPPLPDRIAHLELELAKMKVRIERLELRVKNQVRRRSAETSLEPSEGARHFALVPVGTSQPKPLLAAVLRKRVVLAKPASPEQLFVITGPPPSQFKHRNSKSHRCSSEVSRGTPKPAVFKGFPRRRVGFCRASVRDGPGPRPRRRTRPARPAPHQGCQPA
jgi:hypothetical protein